MTDWASHRRRHPLAEALAWIGAAALVATLAGAGAAFALWLDRTAGEHSASEGALLIDLPPLPPAQAVSDMPDDQPDIPMAEAPEILAPDTPDPETLPAPAPEPEPLAEAPAPLEPPPLSEAPPVPDLAPELAPEPPPELAPEPVVEQAEVALPDQPRPRPRPEAPPKPPEQAQKQPPKQERPEPERPKKDSRQDDRAPRPERAQAPSRAAQGGAQAAAAGNVASANEIDRWKGRVHASFQRHLSRKRFANPRDLAVNVWLDGAGKVVRVAIARSSGDGALDQAVLAHFGRLGTVTPPPPGAPTAFSMALTTK